MSGIYLHKILLPLLAHQQNHVERIRTCLYKKKKRNYEMQTSQTKKKKIGDLIEK